MLVDTLVAVAVVGLIGLVALSAISLNLVLTLDLIPPAIGIYPPRPMIYGFNLDLNPVHVPGINRHRRSGHLQ